MVKEKKLQNFRNHDKKISETPGQNRTSLAYWNLDSKDSLPIKPALRPTGSADTWLGEESKVVSEDAPVS